ncbi:MAG: Rrf2 family transcriptional regulator, partial [Chloroflexota bacterium]|nr:Rrf2 family transcriptional regulator [Chloroflexota bacterium]
SNCNYRSYIMRGSRFSVALHILAHLAEAGEQPTTSEVLAAHCHTHPVVVRRSLAGLREAGIVASTKGHGGGWTMARPPATVSLREVYAVLGERGDLVPDAQPSSHGCLIEAAIGDALDGAYAAAEALLLRRLDEVTLADLVGDLQHRHTARNGEHRRTEMPAG